MRVVFQTVTVSMPGGFSMQAFSAEPDHFHPAVRGLGEAGISVQSPSIMAHSLSHLFLFFVHFSECQMKDPDLSCLAFKTL